MYSATINQTFHLCTFLTSAFSERHIQSMINKKPVKQGLITQLNYVLCQYCQNTQGLCIDSVGYV